eukprot:Transcript_6660.p1 GENE.Transcript_6660~~Transcript_6660.p1  ORF type:complete len:1184 (-),score=466.87 Transcript_6660:386-3937(-)
MAKPFMRYVRLRMTYHDYKSEAKRPNADEEPSRLQPQALDIPDVSSNTWRNSWRKHMVEYMYANGYVMAYPNLPDNRGYATSMFLDGARDAADTLSRLALTQTSVSVLDDPRPTIHDERIAPLSKRLLAFEPVWRQWPVLDLHMRPSSLNKLAAAGITYTEDLPEAWSFLLEHWSQPQCILDRSYAPHKGETPRALMYQPQQTADAQLMAFQHASALATALGRKLIAPRLYSPTVCTSCSRRNISYYYDVADDNVQDWHGSAVAVRAVLQAEQAELATDHKRVWSYLAYGHNQPVVKVPPSVPLPALSLRSAENWLQRCNDDTLFFDGLEENQLPKARAPPFSESIKHAFNAVRSLLKLPKRYMCINLNSRDSVDSCRNRRDSKWFQKLDEDGYQCGVTTADMEEYAERGNSMLILSNHPVTDFVKKYKQKSNNSHLVTTYDVEATAHHHGIKDGATIAMVSQMLCANANRSILNMFSQSSRRISELRKQRGATSTWFRKRERPFSSDPALNEGDHGDDWDPEADAEARAEAEAAAEGRSQEQEAQAESEELAKGYIARAQEESSTSKSKAPKASPAPKKQHVKASPSPKPLVKSKKFEEEEVDEHDGFMAESVDATADADIEPDIYIADGDEVEEEREQTRLRITENPEHTSLVRLSADELEQFSMPKFHGCSGFYDHCHFENVCFSGYDGMLVPNVPGVNFSAFVDEDAPAELEALQPRLVPLRDFRKLKKVYHARGNSYALNCGGQELFNHDPVHYMAGYGKLFVAAHDPTVDRSMDSLIFHQCMQNAPPDWSWSQGMWSLLEGQGKDAGLWSPKAVDTVTLAAATNTSDMSRLPQEHDPVVCAKRVTMERRWASTFLGGNVPGIVGRWRSRVDSWLNKEAKGVAKILKRKLKKTNKLKNTDDDDAESRVPLKAVGDCALFCSKQLRVAVLQRDPEQPSIHNLEEVGDLVAEYTREPLQTLLVHDKVSFEEQVAAFRSFDILITPSTPYLTNLMFAVKNAVVIEMQTAPYDTVSMQNGKNFLTFVRSSGHLPVKSAKNVHLTKKTLTGISLAELASSNATNMFRCSLQVDCELSQAMDHCWGREDTCGLHKAKAFNNADMYADVGRMRTALEEALALRCSCKSAELVERLQQNRTGPCPGSGDCCQTPRAMAANDYFYHSCNDAVQEAKLQRQNKVDEDA